MHLKDIQGLIPTAETIAGQVICFHDGKHHSLGEYLGGGLVKLSGAGEAIVNALLAAAPVKATPVKDKPTKEKVVDDKAAGLDLSGLQKL